jgi:hypothetical protein
MVLGARAWRCKSMTPRHLDLAKTPVNPHLLSTMTEKIWQDVVENFAPFQDAIDLAIVR